MKTIILRYQRKSNHFQNDKQHENVIPEQKAQKAPHNSGLIINGVKMKIYLRFSGQYQFPWQQRAADLQPLKTEY
jgi:hypothetical protein